MRQTETNECGLVCLAIAAEALGSKLEMSSLRQKYPISSRGMTMREVRDIASDMGMVGRVVRCEVHELKDLKIPAILHWGFNHFVVLRKVTRRGVRIEDPSCGLRDIPIKEVSRKFTGMALELTPSDEFVRRREPSPLKLSSWFRLTSDTSKALAKVFILSILIQCFLLATPLYVQIAIDQSALKGDREILVVLAVGFALVCLFNAVANWVRSIVTSRLNAMLTWDMTVRLFRHAIRLPLPWYQRRKLADILSRFDAIVPVRNLLSGAMVIVVVDGILALATIILMFYIAPPLAWLVCGGFAAFVMIRLAGMSISVRLGMDVLSSRVAENGKRIETMRAIQSIKVMAAETEREGDWANKFAATVRSDQNSEFASSSFTSLQSLLDGLVRILVVYMGAVRIMNGDMSIGLFYAFLTYQSQFSARAGALFNQIVNWRMTDMYSHRLADIVLTPKEVGIDSPQTGHVAFLGAVRVQGLSFAFSPRDPAILHNLNVEIRAGEFVAIVGPSGSGKSTLLKILCGLYPATQGEIYLDQLPLKSWPLKTWRRSLGVVMQDDELLGGTILENVTFFDACPNIDGVREALRQAALLDEVMAMPMRMETYVGDMGSSVSGGQRQRLLLARALYRKPKLLVLDEATSHLDIQKEIEINRELSALKITRIVVAHRRETIAAADRILRLENGRLVAVESFSEASE